MVTRLLRLAELPRPADAADALALAICHVWRGAGTVPRSRDGGCEDCPVSAPEFDHLDPETCTRSTPTRTPFAPGCSSCGPRSATHST